MPIIEGFDFFSLKFDDHGTLQSRQEFEALTARANSATDVIFIAHGFRNDEHDATNLYTRFLGTFRANLSRPEFSALANRQFVFAGVYWPSKPFRETSTRDRAAHADWAIASPTLADAKAQLEELKDDNATPAQRRNLDRAIALLPTLETNAQAQDEFVELVLSLVDDSGEDATEGLPQIRQRPGSEILARLSPPADGTRGIGDVAGKHRRRRGPIPEPDDVVHDEGAIGNGRRHGRRQGRANTARRLVRVFASTSWDTAWAAAWRRLAPRRSPKHRRLPSIP